jgi:hypothetical protein
MTQARWGFNTGVSVSPLALGPLSIRCGRQWYYALAAAATAATFVCVNLGRSWVGRAWMALRDLVYRTQGSVAFTTAARSVPAVSDLFPFPPAIQDSFAHEP